ncbi:hypothetical protein FCV25MIE_28106, partial [Fagus crenata]
MVLMLCSPHLKEGYAKGSCDRCPKILIFKQYRCLKKQVGYSIVIFLTGRRAKILRETSS